MGCTDGWSDPVSQYGGRMQMDGEKYISFLRRKTVQILPDYSTRFLHVMITNHMVAVSIMGVAAAIWRPSAQCALDALCWYLRRQPADLLQAAHVDVNVLVQAPPDLAQRIAV